MNFGRLTTEQRVFVIEQYWKLGNASKVQDAWRQHYVEPPPHRDTVYKIRDRFHDTGKVSELPRSGRPKSRNTNENAALVATALQQSPLKSARRLSKEIGIPRSSLQKILCTNGYKPYRPQLIHGLLEDDSDRRMEMCTTFIAKQLDDDQFMRNIIWTDEATFNLNGILNRHNCVYYDTTNPHRTIEKQMKSPSICVWAAISHRGLIGPYFYDTPINAVKYHDMLSTYVFPLLRQLDDFDDLWLMQDGAPPHFGNIVRNFLDENAPVGWIGRRGTIDWAPRSPDLTPMDFFLWGAVKDKVFSSNPTTLENLRAAIIRELAVIDNNKELCAKVCESVLGRMDLCVQQNGLQFEHLM